MPVIALQVELFGNVILPEYMVASPHSLGKAQVSQQATQLVEAEYSHPSDRRAPSAVAFRVGSSAGRPGESIAKADSPTVPGCGHLPAAQHQYEIVRPEG